MPLTESKLQALYGKRNKSTKLIPDRDGLYISCGLKGKLSWVFRYRYDGEQKRLTFATYPACTLSEARDKSIHFRRMLEAGNDPKREAEEQGAKITIEDCASAWFNARKPMLRKGTIQNYTVIKDKYFINSRFNFDLNKVDLEKWIKYFDDIAAESTPVNAGNVLRVLKTMLRWCKARSMISKADVLDLNVSHIGAKPRQGQRNLQMNEVGLLWVLVSKSRVTPALKNCVKLQMLFGARQAEIREAPRSEFDLELGVWTLPPERSKNGNEIRRPIPSKAKAIIEELDDTYGKGGFLIPGYNKDTFITHTAFTRYIRRLRVKMLKYNPQCRSFTSHDFRRTLSTRLSEKDILPHVTEKMLGHELGGIMAVYNKHDWIDDQRKAYELWAKMIGEAAQKELSRLCAM